VASAVFSAAARAADSPASWAGSVLECHFGVVVLVPDVALGVGVGVVVAADAVPVIARIPPTTAPAPTRATAPTTVRLRFLAG